MKQLRSVSHNNIHITGFLVKDAYVNPTGTMAAFRIAHSLGRDKKGLFFGCVIFGALRTPAFGCWRTVTPCAPDG